MGRLRRPLCGRDFDCAARRADHSVSSGPARSRFSATAGRPAARIIPGDRRRSASPRASRSTPAARAFTSSAKICSTPARTKSTTRSARCCSPRRMGKRRIIAETGAGQHGVATAPCARCFGLECVVYMGAEDMRRQALNVFRMQSARRGGARGRQPDRGR